MDWCEASKTVRLRQIVEDDVEWEEFYATCLSVIACAEKQFGKVPSALIVPLTLTYTVKAAEVFLESDLTTNLGIDEIYFSNVTRVYALHRKIPEGGSC